MVSKYWGSPQPRIDTRTRTRIVKCPSSGHQLQVPIISASSHFTSVMRRTNLEIVSAHKECWLRFSVSSRRLILYRITITRAVSGAYRNFTMPGGGPIHSTCLKCILALSCSWRRTKISRSLVDSSSYHGYCSLQFWNEKNYPFIDIWAMRNPWLAQPRTLHSLTDLRAIVDSDGDDDIARVSEVKLVKGTL